MTYEVSIETGTEYPTAVVAAELAWAEFPTAWRPMLDEVWAFLGSRPGLRSDGHNVMLYRPVAVGTGAGADIAVEIGVQVTSRFEPVGRVVPSTLPGGDTATTVHTGPPAEIGAAHDAVRAWCEAHDRPMTGWSWEIYGDPDPETGSFAVAVHWQLA